MSTNAKPRSIDSGHYYSRDAKPVYEVKRSDGKGMRPTTVADARKLGLLPSPTTILKTLNKPALTDWLIEQACLSVLTTPRIDGEDIDAFVYRVLHVERHQDAESSAAKDRGSAIHEAIELALNDVQWDASLVAYVEPVLKELNKFGRVVSTEKIVVGPHVAGKTDLICESDNAVTVVDFKTAKKLPPKPYPEHRMQLAFYASALGNTGDKRIECVNIYISTTNPGEIAVCPLGDWSDDIRKFKLLTEFWYLQNGMEFSL